MIETNEAGILEALEVLNISESVSAFMSCVYVGKIQRLISAQTKTTVLHSEVKK